MPSTVIAFSGKGGAGKTTLASLTVKELVRAGNKPVLAVDADPNATLAMGLGVDCPGTISDLREDMLKAAKEPSEIPKDRLMDQWLAELLSEEIGFDLLTMGRPEGPHCYCYVNGLLRRYLQLLRGNYPVVVVDCEAGMEYLSRLTVEDVDTLVLAAEPTAVGLATVRRIAELADGLPITVRRRVLVLNKTGAPGVETHAMDSPDLLPAADTIIEMPYDASVAQQWADGGAVDANLADATREALAQFTQACLGTDTLDSNRSKEETDS
ncbi:MAG: ATP-binding protein [Planctomycetota bacterium]